MLGTSKLEQSNSSMRQSGIGAAARLQCSLEVLGGLGHILAVQACRQATGGRGHGNVCKDGAALVHGKADRAGGAAVPGGGNSLSPQASSNS